MRLSGYILDRGIMPEYILQLTREERLLYRAMIELNQEEQDKRMTAAFYNALVMFANEGKIDGR